MDGSSSRLLTVPPSGLNAALNVSNTASSSVPGERVSNRSLTLPSLAVIRWAVSREVNAAAKFACASRPPSGVMMKKYSGERTWPMY